MSACSHDSEGKIAPLAIGIADIENEVNLIYFLRFLAKSIPELKTPGMVIMHDCEKRLHYFQDEIYLNSCESICVYQLERYVNSRF